ncbi:hypothetical protein QR680_017773 [Steinernema hermaphroditum]|uniref:Uncharacterized protein n=1 Tax=Steinernema hermaphroditum TaxID=289476 RepID=A0AA39HFR6_9BILA|nr:hypothetical protein QR680_017773 [Steinernema hermaphroditum]
MRTTVGASALLRTIQICVLLAPMVVGNVVEDENMKLVDIEAPIVGFYKVEIKTASASCKVQMKNYLSLRVMELKKGKVVDYSAELIIEERTGKNDDAEFAKVRNEAVAMYFPVVMPTNGTQYVKNATHLLWTVKGGDGFAYEQVTVTSPGGEKTVFNINAQEACKCSNFMVGKNDRNRYGYYLSSRNALEGTVFTMNVTPEEVLQGNLKRKEKLSIGTENNEGPSRDTNCIN